MLKTKILNIADIRIDAGTQTRFSINEQTVMDYKELMKDGVVFAPIDVMFDGLEYYLVDGFHRYHAHIQNGQDTIAAVVTNGTLRYAKLMAKKANSHGLPLTKKEKRKNVFDMLDDIEYCEWSNKDIALHNNVSHSMVIKMRQELENPKPKKDAGNKPSKDNPSKDKLKADEPPQQEAEPVDTRANDALVMLSEENETLAQRLAVAAMDATEEEKAMASTLITDYVEQIRLLKIDLVAVKVSRDQYQNENAELKKQIASLQRQLKKQS